MQHRPAIFAALLGQNRAGSAIGVPFYVRRRQPAPPSPDGLYPGRWFLVSVLGLMLGFGAIPNGDVGFSIFGFPFGTVMLAAVVAAMSSRARSR